MNEINTILNASTPNHQDYRRPMLAELNSNKVQNDTKLAYVMFILLQPIPGFLGSLFRFIAADHEEISAFKSPLLFGFLTLGAFLLGVIVEAAFTIMTAMGADKLESTKSIIAREYVLYSNQIEAREAILLLYQHQPTRHANPTHPAPNQ